MGKLCDRVLIALRTPLPSGLVGFKLVGADVTATKLQGADVTATKLLGVAVRTPLKPGLVGSKVVSADVTAAKLLGADVTAAEVSTEEMRRVCAVVLGVIAPHGQLGRTKVFVGKLGLSLLEAATEREGSELGLGLGLGIG